MASVADPPENDFDDVGGLDAVLTNHR